MPTGYKYHPMMPKDEVVRSATLGYTSIAVGFTAVCVAVFLLATTGTDRVSDVTNTPVKAYQVGDVGSGVPSAVDVGLCPGEVIYYPDADVWRCE